MTARTAGKRILKLGGYQVRQRGSHRFYEARRTLPDGTVVVANTVVPQHSGDIAVGTLRSIERDMELVFGERWLR